MDLDSLLRRLYVAAAILWVVVLPLATAAAATSHAPAGEYAFAALTYSIGRVICHQQPGRSFHLWGVQLPVCARCTGVYLGAAAAAVVLLSTRLWPRQPGRPGSPRADRAILLAACVPIGLTLIFEWTTGIATSNTVRSLSGLPAGAAVTWAVLTRR